jgi:hypothetical protein
LWVNDTVGKMEKRVRIYSSFEAENQAEAERRGRMTPEERMRELAVLQDRVWGKDWREKPMIKVATWEWVDW